MGDEVIARLPGWEARLSAHIVAHLGAAFRWGRTDCAMFAAGSVEALSGVDLARGFRGYRSEAEGLRAVRAKGLEDYEAVFARSLETVPVEMMAPGDVAVILEGGRPVMGVFSGPHVHVMGPGGCAVLPASRILRGYAV